jgi:hypothetical protein
MPVSITLSLISHTNVGKTTLVRTLLRRDVGEVLDREHVTDVSEAHTLIEAGGARLELWDTPGFGSTASLMRRLRRHNDPLGWFLSQVWDRVMNRPLWCSQQAVRNVRDEADVVLYLVNAAEDPEEAGYVPPELEILAWMGRPVLLLLNQVGREGDGLVTSWRKAVENSSAVKDVLALDAFTRCWVEEGTLLQRVEPLLPEPKREAMRTLREAWHERNLAQFRSCCGWIADYLGRAALDREPLRRETGAQGVAHLLRNSLKPDGPTRRRAMRSLNERLDRSTSELMDRMLAAHGLSGSSAARIERRIREFEVRGEGWPLDERSGALLGGAVSGALGGLAADALSGGLSLGGGMIAGGILGALGGAALGRGYRLIRGGVEPAVSWSPDFLDRLFRQALLRYLAVAHFGRGQGDYRDLEQPARWGGLVDEQLVADPDGLRRLWELAGRPGEHETLQQELLRVVEGTARAVLLRAYPDARDLSL